MSNRLVFSGLEELRAQLRTLPADLAEEASVDVHEAARAAKSAIVDAYPDRTGDLRDHVVLEDRAAGPFGAAVIVKNTSKLAWIFENGSQARHTALGANRGSMPPGHVFLPNIIRQRRTMYEKLRALLVAHGLVVTGEP